MPSRARVSSFLGELQRRHVIKVAIVYVVVGLGVAQAADVAWAYDITGVW